MKEYLLIWSNQDFPDMGGGTNYEFYNNLKELEDRVNSLQIVHKGLFHIDYACRISKELIFKPVESVVTWKLED